VQCFPRLRSALSPGRGVQTVSQTKPAEYSIAVGLREAQLGAPSPEG
jgi:hypothetical protein